MNYGVVISVVIYELVVILGCAVWLKIKEKKQAAAPTDEDFALGGRNMGVIVLAPAISCFDTFTLFVFSSFFK